MHVDTDLLLTLTNELSGGTNIDDIERL